MLVIHGLDVLPGSYLSLEILSGLAELSGGAGRVTPTLRASALVSSP